MNKPVNPEEFFAAYGGQVSPGNQQSESSDEAGNNRKSKSVHSRSRRQADHQPLRVIDPRALFGRPVPERRWIVPGWLPCGHVTANYGDGGTGKTLLAQQLMTATALGKPWCGLAVEPCRSFGLFCEDDEDELHRRQEAILIHYNAGYNQLADMRWTSGVGRDNTLLRFDRDGIGEATETLTEIAVQAKAFDARLVVIDTAADTFGGNENDRQQVRQFIGNHLNRLAIAINGAVLLNAHPSRSGLSATGDLDGGSTAWSNSVRSRWSLARPKTEDGREQDTDERILTRRKANYAQIGEEIALRWQKGVLVPQRGNGETAIDQMTRWKHAEEMFLTLLDKCLAQNVFVSSSKNAGNFAPKVFAKRPERAGCSRADFDGAMSRLLAEGKVANALYGRKSDARYRIERAPEESHEDTLNVLCGGPEMTGRPV
jgi:RecA-family ATPase